MNPEKELRFSPAFINGCVVFGLCLAGLFSWYGFSTGIFTSQQGMEQFLLRCGLWAPAIFMVLQAVQVVVPIMPCAIGCVGGVLVFGPWLGFLYSYIGICTGSVMAFLLARRYGRGLVRSVGGEKVWAKYSHWLDDRRFDTFFTIAIFLPVAPDDFLCYLAGLGRMSVLKFTTILLLAKPMGIGLYSLTLYGLLQMVTGLF